MANRYLSTLFNSGEEFEEFLDKLEKFKVGVKSGEIEIPNATKAKQDGDGNVIPDTYAKTSDLTSGAITVKKATSATSATSATTATKATQDGDGNVIGDTYAKTSALKNGNITVLGASTAMKATNDSEGNKIVDTYAKKTDLTSGAITVKNATNLSIDTKTLTPEREAIGTYVYNVSLTAGRIYIFNCQYNDSSSDGYDGSSSTLLLYYAPQNESKRITSTIGGGRTFDGELIDGVDDYRLVYFVDEKKLRMYGRVMDKEAYEEPCNGRWSSMHLPMTIKYREI